ncbi:MAG: phage major capsid protein [Gammaproteobacteria bacterium]|nr:phage major capsid protein [Gammaproteobacteria bacterium]
MVLGIQAPDDYSSSSLGADNVRAHFFRSPTGLADCADFSRYAACLAIARGDLVAATDAAAARGWSRPTAILRAAVAAGTTTDPAWAKPLVDHERVAQAFIESLRSVGVFDSSLPGMVQVPIESSLAITTLGAVGASQAQATWRPISRLQLAGAKLQVRHASAAVVLSSELLRTGGDPAIALLEAELRGAAASIVDKVFIDELSDSVAGQVMSSGSTPSQISADLGALLVALALGSRSEPRFVVSAGTAAILATMTGTEGCPVFPDMTPQGGRIAGVPVLVSDEIDDSSILAFDAQQLAGASDTITLDATNAADLRISDPGDAASLTSLWQNNMAALRAQRFFGFERLRPTASALLSGGAWAASS